MAARSFGWVFALLLAAGTSQAQTPADFSGDWIARDAAPDNTAAKTGDSSGAHSRGSGARMGGHGGGRSHGGQNAGANSGSGVRADADSAPRASAQAMIIRQSDDVFDIEVDGQRMAYRFDGRNNYGPQYGGTVTLTWATPEMVIETHPDAGGSVEEHYALSADGKSMTLLVRTQQSDSTVRETRRVFVHPGDAGLKTASGIALP
jgi:hypothetical protein